MKNNYLLDVKQCGYELSCMNVAYGASCTVAYHQEKQGNVHDHYCIEANQICLNEINVKLAAEKH